MADEIRDQELEVEYALIGAIVIEPTVLDNVRRYVRPKDFSIKPLRGLYAAACQMQDNGNPIDALTLLETARRGGVEAERDLIVQCVQITPTAANAAKHAELLREYSARRQLRALTGKVNDALISGEHTALETSAALARAVEAMDTGTTQLVSGGEAMLDFFAYRERMEHDETSAFVRTGYPDLDLQLGGGMVTDGLYICAARPGVGKTLLGLNVAENVARDIGPVIYITLEMSAREITARRICNVSGIGTTALMGMTLSDAQQEQLAQASVKIDQRQMYVNSSVDMAVDDIEQAVRSVKDRKLVVIDYIGLVKKINPRQNLYEHMTELSRALKLMAGRYHVPILALAQLNREIEKRSGADRRPQLSDLRESGALEQDADGILMLYRGSMYSDAGASIYGADAMDVYVRKNRHGPTGKVVLDAYLNNGRIRSPQKDHRKDDA